MTCKGGCCVGFFSFGKFGVLIPIVLFLSFFFFCVFHLYSRRYKVGLLFFIIIGMHAPRKNISYSVSLDFIPDPRQQPVLLATH